MKKREILRPLLGLAAIAAAAAIFFTAIDNIDAGHAAEDRAQIEMSLRRGAAACYAAEGIYPPDLAYLQEHYGIRVDEERYNVVYEYVASNLMPQITVIEENEE